MRILLVSLIKDFLRADKPHKPKGTIFLRFPSLALANIAALTPARHQIIIADEQIAPINYDDDYNLVAISVNTSVAPRAYAIADKFRAKGVKVVLGGLHPSLMPDEAQEHADAVVIGDAETTWPQLMQDFENKKIKKRYMGSVSGPLILPTPRWEIFEKMGYVNFNFVEATRGCSHSCRFCSTSHFYGHRHRVRPVEDVVRDVKSVKSFPRKFIFFVDDNIVGDKKYAKTLFRALAPLHIYWISQATVDIGDDEELIRLAAESGCFGLFLGFESVSQTNLAAMNKAHNHVEKYFNTIKLIHKYGIGIEAGYIFGFDKDDPSTFRTTFEFLKKTDTDSFLAIYLTPIPGTEMYQDFSKEKRLITSDYSEYDFRHIVFKPKSMSAKEVYNGVSWITKEFYSKKLVTRRFLNRLWNFVKQPSIRRLLVVVGLLAISLGFRKRIKDLSKNGTFPKSFGNI